MKNFTICTLILFGLSFTTQDLSAFTTSSQFSLKEGFIECELPVVVQSELNSICNFENAPLPFKELKATTANSSTITQSKLNILYSLCFALVLFNLMAQIKIIFQMIHLFFLFRKKEESVRLNF